jgi:hypothetical protein
MALISPTKKGLLNAYELTGNTKDQVIKWIQNNAVKQPQGTTAVAADVLAIPVTHSVVTKTTGADAEALTLANGSTGQMLTITLVVDGGGDATLSPTTTTGFTDIVFADAGDTATLQFVDSTVGWVVVGAAGVAAPPVIAIT